MIQPSQVDPLNPGTPLELSDKQKLSVDPEFRKQAPAFAALNRFKPMDTVERSQPYSIGNALQRPLLGMGKMVSPMFNNGALMGTAAGAGLGFAGGWLGDKLMNTLFGVNPGLAWKLGLLGAGAGGYTGFQRSKTANFQMPKTQTTGCDNTRDGMHADMWLGSFLEEAGSAYSSSAQKSASLNLDDVSDAMRLGMATVTASMGRPLSDVQRAFKSAAARRDTSAAHFGKWQTMICKLAAAAYREAGRMERLEFHVFNTLAKSAEWNPRHNGYVDAATAALAKNAHVPESTDLYVKTGAALGNLAGAVGRLGITASPALLRSLLAASAVGGGAAGSLYWLANRHSREDSNDLEGMKQKLDYYNGLTGDITDELHSRGLKTSRPEDENAQQ